MGNETSQPASNATTPASEGHSVYSFGSVRRSSAASSQHSSPVEPPQPDLSHLTEDEIAQIRSVIDRAKQIQMDETTRVRDIEEDYTSYAADIVRKSSWSDLENEDKTMCPICNVKELKLNSDGTRTNQNVCKDCEELTCDECGDYSKSLSTKSPPKQGQTEEKSAQKSDVQLPQQQPAAPLSATSSSSNEATGGAEAGVIVSQPPLPPPRRKLRKAHSTNQTPLPCKESDVSGGKAADVSSKVAPSAKSKPHQKSVRHAHSVPAPSTDKGGRQVHSAANSTTAAAVGDVSAAAAATSSSSNNREAGRKLSAVVSSSKGSSSDKKTVVKSSEPAAVEPGVVFPCQSTAGPSRLRGATATRSRSDSECSDPVSEVDWEEMTMSKYHSEATSPDGSSAEDEEDEDYGREGIISGKPLRRKHRPRFLNISRSLSVTSSDDEADEKSYKMARLEHVKHISTSEKSSDKNNSGNKSDSDGSLKEARGTDGVVHHGVSVKGQLMQEQQHQQSMDFLSDGKAVRSPSPPRSPSWREGLDSPPFSPRRRDSYPAKKRGHLSPLSPKDKKFQFSYVDTSPTKRHLSAENLYDGSHQSEISPSRSPLTPEELKKAFGAVCGQSTQKESSSSDSSRKSTSLSVSSTPHHRDNNTKDQKTFSLGMDTEVIDLATYAATIASNTASLTSLSASPTSLPTTSIEGPDSISPESITSTDSTSPISPNYYDGSQSEEGDVELADPSTKSIDYQGTKRQKQRPPSSDWSPVIDLSPIIDVSPSVEEAEQQEMLAQQREVLRKRESDADSESEEEDGENSSPEKKNLDNYEIPCLKRYMNFEDISKICEGKIPDEKKIERISDMLSDFQKINRNIDILTYPILRSNGDKENIITTTSSASNPRSGTSDVVTTLPIARPPLATYTMAPVSTAVTTSPPVTITTVSVSEEETDWIIHPLPSRGMRPTISTSSLSELMDSGGEESELMTAWNLAQSNVTSKTLPSLQTSTSVVTATSLAMSATIVTSAAASSSCSVSRAEQGDRSATTKPMKPAIAPKPTTAAKNMPAAGKASEGKAPVKPGPVDNKPEPPPRIRRKLPEPTPEILATHRPPKPPKPARTPSTCASSATTTTRTSPVNVVPGQPTRPLPPPPAASKSVKSLTEAFEVKTAAMVTPEVKHKPAPATTAATATTTVTAIATAAAPTITTTTTTSTTTSTSATNTTTTTSTTTSAAAAAETKPPSPAVEPKPAKAHPIKQEPEKKKAKDIKAKLRSQQKHGEQCYPPSQLKVLDSPVTPPEPSVSVLKREYSDSTSVSPSSSPDHELDAYPSPGTPPDSDTSPPKALSPSSPKGSSSSTRTVKPLSSQSGTDTKKLRPISAPRTNVSETQKPKDGNKKVRRKLPAIPADEEPVTAPRAITPKKGPSYNTPPAPSRKAPTLKTGKPATNIDPALRVDESTRESIYSSQVMAPLTSLDTTTSGHSNGRSGNPNIGHRQKLGPIPSKGGSARNGKPTEGGAIGKMSTSSHQKPGFKSDQQLRSDVEEINIFFSERRAMNPEENIRQYRSASFSEYQRLTSKRSELHGASTTLLHEEFSQDDNDQIIDSLVSIYGIPISTAMKSLKRRLQDELRKVTESRRRKIEELEEIHALEQQIEELKMESISDSKAASFLSNGHKTRSLPRNGRGLVTSSSFDKSTAVRSSPQIIPRRSRHRRQASDPMIAKFSPIKEDKDIEADFQAKASETYDGKFSKYSTDDSSQSGLSDTESTRSEPTGESLNSAYKKIKPSAYAKMFYTGRAQSTERINSSDSVQYLSSSAPLSSSQSESFLSEGFAGQSRTPTYFSDDEEKRTKEEKRQILQYEIEKRKKQLEETARLQHELIRLSRARQAVAHSYDDIPRRYAYSTSPRHVPTGIIKPLDDELPFQLERYVHSSHDIHTSDGMDAKRAQEIAQAQAANYSSTEYLAHKQELARRQLYDDYSTYGSYPPYDAGLGQSQVYPSSPNLMNRSDSGPVIIQSMPPTLPSSGISGSVTLPEINRSDMDIMPSRDLHQHQFSSDTDNSPASDYTPAMPLLDDITTRSRKILHDIGNRPLSAEFNLPGGVDDLMNAMYRVESDNSVDADEPIMKHMTEGGVTILKQLERKKQPAPTQPKRYLFITKRILLTRDPKDKSIKGGTGDPKDLSMKGNGIGMKIVGGKQQGPDEEMVAYVAAIYPGGIAEQLHGELEEGDQILEWNGIELTGKTYEEVQQTISHPNGEIELVVRPGTKLCPKDGEAGNLQDGSCHSSYDNLEYISDDDDDEYDRCMEANQHGVDPEQLAAQLEGIRDPAHTSPGDSPSSSSHQDYFLTPSMSTSACSTPHSDLTISNSSDRQRHAIDKTLIQQDSNMGDLMLQISFDEYENSLNVLVIQARNLLRGDFSGLSDPFVKVYLLPGRSPDHKRRTRYVSCTLNPEWHQNLVFQNLSRDDLKTKILEITVWDYDRFKPNDFLGQVVIDLKDDCFIDGQSHWYHLCQQNDNQTSTDLPKPTVGPHYFRPMTITDSQMSHRLGDYPTAPRRYTTQGRSQHISQMQDSAMQPEVKRRKSIGTIAEDRLQPDRTSETSSSRSSPIPQSIPRDTQASLINQNRNPQCNISTSSLHQSATILRKKALQSVGGSLTSDSSPEPT